MLRQVWLVSCDKPGCNESLPEEFPTDSEARARARAEGWIILEGTSYIRTAQGLKAFSDYKMVCKACAARMCHSACRK